MGGKAMGDEVSRSFPQYWNRIATISSQNASMRAPQQDLDDDVFNAGKMLLIVAVMLLFHDNTVITSSMIPVLKESVGEADFLHFQQCVAFLKNRSSCVTTYPHVISFSLIFENEFLIDRNQYEDGERISFTSVFLTKTLINKFIRCLVHTITSSKKPFVSDTTIAVSHDNCVKRTADFILDAHETPKSLTAPHFAVAVGAVPRGTSNITWLGLESSEIKKKGSLYFGTKLRKRTTDGVVSMSTPEGQEMVRKELEFILENMLLKWHTNSVEVLRDLGQIRDELVENIERLQQDIQACESSSIFAEYCSTVHEIVDRYDITGCMNRLHEHNELSLLELANIRIEPVNSKALLMPHRDCPNEFGTGKSAKPRRLKIQKLLSMCSIHFGLASTVSIRSARVSDVFHIDIPSAEHISSVSSSASVFNDASNELVNDDKLPKVMCATAKQLLNLDLQ
jgi:hypothetical protein